LENQQYKIINNTETVILVIVDILLFFILIEYQPQNILGAIGYTSISGTAMFLSSLLVFSVISDILTPLKFEKAIFISLIVSLLGFIGGALFSYSIIRI